MALVITVLCTASTDTNFAADSSQLIKIQRNTKIKDGEITMYYSVGTKGVKKRSWPWKGMATQC
jgi:hypothetical protein